MTGSRSATVLILGLLVWCLGSAAQAQDLWEGKTPEQLFRLNCSVCHKSPVGLATAGEKAGGLFGLESFLAQHYTASGRSAGLIANYLKAVDREAAQRRSEQPHRRANKPRKPAGERPDSAGKSDAGRPDKEKAGEGKGDTPKADAAARSTGDKSEPKAGKPGKTEPKAEKAATGADGARDDNKSGTTRPGSEGNADKKTN